MFCADDVLCIQEYKDKCLNLFGSSDCSSGSSCNILSI